MMGKLKEKLTNEKGTIKNNYKLLTAGCKIMKWEASLLSVSSFVTGKAREYLNSSHKLIMLLTTRSMCTNTSL